MHANRFHRAAVILGLACATALPAQALGVCANPPLAESRHVVFSPPLFDARSRDLSGEGQSALEDFAQTLQQAQLEALVVSVPVPAAADAAALALARQRGEAVRDALVRQGVAPGHIYLEQRRSPAGAAAADRTPLVIETVAAWRRPAALARGWRCVG